MTRTARHRRPAFSLIELLVVISIIALLMALSAGAYFRVRNSQLKSASVATVVKVNIALDNRVKAIRDAAKDQIRKRSTPQALAALKDANNDPEVAETLLIYAKMKNELPMTFAEARAITIIGTIRLNPRGHFSALGTGGATPEESGICLFIALTNSGGDGAVAEGGLEQQGIDWKIGSTTYRTFADAYGTPLAFVRHCYAQEVQDPPYVKGTKQDPYDPSQGSKASQLLTSRWSAIKPPALTGYTPPAAYSSTSNHVPTVISAGPNREFETTSMFAATSDNLFGYRLRREGSQGN